MYPLFSLKLFMLLLEIKASLPGDKLPHFCPYLECMMGFFEGSPLSIIVRTVSHPQGIYIYSWKVIYSLYSVHMMVPSLVQGPIPFIYQEKKRRRNKDTVLEPNTSRDQHYKLVSERLSLSVTCSLLILASACSPV